MKEHQNKAFTPPVWIYLYLLPLKFIDNESNLFITMNIDRIPWQGSESQETVLFFMGAAVFYAIYIVIAKKDTNSSPRKSLWK